MNPCGFVSNRLQTPTLIGCIFLMNLKATSIACLFVRPATISEALQYTPVFDFVSNFFKAHTTTRSGTHFLEQEAPLTHLREGLCFNNSLTMTYFHTGTRTIIGAKSFHCPVRDGKEWDQLAMVVRHNLLPGCACGTTGRIHRVWNQLF